MSEAIFPKGFSVMVTYDLTRDRHVLTVGHDGEVVFTETDGGEPEDQTFGRNLNWIPDALYKAYELGFKDGKESK